MSEYHKAIVVICTRPDSRRLPGKVFKKIAGLPAIEHILSRLGVRRGMSMSPRFPVVLAVPETCDAYDHLLEKYDIEIFEGNTESPLHRMADAFWNWAGYMGPRGVDARKLGERQMPKYVVRVTHDDILIDLKTVVDLVEYVEQHGAGYGTTPGIVDGAGVEVIHMANLMKAAEKLEGQNIEHISYFVRGEGLPAEKVVTMETRPEISRPYRLTLDYQEDADVLEAVLREVGPLSPLERVCCFLDQNQEILDHNKMPLVSVYIPAHNAEKWIVQSAMSVPKILSDETRVELVIADDASADGTLTKILRMGDHVDRVVVNEENRGSASTANAALRACHGRYVVRLDADDVLEPEAIEKLLSEIQKTRAGVVYPSFYEFEELVSGRRRDIRVLRANCDPKENHHSGGAIMDRKAFDVKYEDGRRNWDGLELFNRIKKSGVKVGYLNESLWGYRKSQKSLSAKMTPERERDLMTAQGYSRAH